MSLTACIHCNTDSWLDVTSVKFNRQKVHEDKIFKQQGKLQFLKHDQVGFLCSFQVFIWRINLSRTIEYFKIWQRLLNIVLAEIAVNCTDWLLIHRYMRDYIYRVSQKNVDPFKFKLAITYCINLNALILLCYGA